MERNFRDLTENQFSKGKFVCVGLDSEYKKIPEFIRNPRWTSPWGIHDAIVSFNKAIVESTLDIVGFYKPNTAFYEQYGDIGIKALFYTISIIREMAPDVPVILDAKRADIGNTNRGYVEFAFDYLGADAITVHPYLGAEALEPFLERKDKGVFVLCRTSNPGASELQNIKVSNGWVRVNSDPSTIPLYQYVAKQVAENWNKNGNCGVVVGATYPDELRQVRKLVGDMPILIPGIGAQGGDLQKTIDAGKDSRGMGMIVNSSRGIIFASNGENFDAAARRETQKLHDGINTCLAQPCSTCGNIMVRSGRCWKCQNCGATAGC